MTDFEKDVDLACQTERGHPFIFKEVNTCNPATITGTLSRISLDDEDEPKLASHQEGVNFSSLPGNVPPPQPAGAGQAAEPRRGRPALPPPRPRRSRCAPAESEAYPDFVAVDHVGLNINRSYGTLKQLPAHGHAHSLQFKQRPSVRQILASGTVERTRTLPRNLGSTSTSTSVSVGSLERKRVRYSELDFEKVMHTRKRHSELYHELNHSAKFHTIDRYNRDPAMSAFKREKRWSISSAGGEKNSLSDKSIPDDQHSWDSFKTMTPDPSTGPSGEQKDKLELHNKTWDTSSAHTADTSEGDFQTEV
ncbi:hypothetical protein SKAU_G00402560 [Synaphobranchus kaupii]|uniref:Uncharacterized protein n=1 Tax=Synaphobranchus kaupii TaxID=118154 RepID=A0A9Q1E9C2_SYNKA|nr:hypothetical protein SKAU_G00402560 [Synaphobranchus kaupii]